MNTFPLRRVKWSNEHIMAGLFLVLGLYHMPSWINQPSSLLSFLLLLVVGLLLDTVSNFIRYRKPICAVSTSVTVAIISIVTTGVPILGRFLAVAVAVLIGKQIWGGTGKNIINPAVTGLLFTAIFYNISYPPFEPVLLLIPALLLSLPFLGFRPWAGTGYMLGMMAAMLLGGVLDVVNILSSGVIFWGCLVLTDPVTVTRQPIPGFILSLMAGFSALFFGPSMLSISISILCINILSYLVDRIIYPETLKERSGTAYKPGLKIKRFPSMDLNNKQCIDLTVMKDSVGIDDKKDSINDRVEESKDANSVLDEKVTQQGHINNDLQEGCRTPKDLAKFSQKEILERLKNNGVFGFGGAAFPTCRKIKTVMNAEVSKKHFIINAVECDPGLIHDKWLLLNHLDEIYQGIELVSKCVDFDSITLALKDSSGIDMKPDSNRFNISTVADYFPMGAEKILISEIHKKQIPPDEIPAEQGILVLNVQTVYTIYKAVLWNEKVNSRYITVANLQKNEAEVVKVNLVTGVREVIEAIYPGSMSSIFSGGGIMQSSIAGDEAIIDKKVNFIAVADFPRYKESLLCSKCGICVKNCPAGLEVNLIADLIDQKDFEMVSSYQIEKCIGCGCCSYSCLAGRNLAARLKIAKNEMQKIG
ncbi:MAG: RnfABCDGE type electron transport complex subunit D [Halanaerobiales bacterium]